jgi:hypothetical protein
MSSRRNSSPEINWPEVIVPGIFFSYIFFTCMAMALNDPDLWWHLKTGGEILGAMSLPDSDPFAFTTKGPLSEQNLIGLRAQWLGQVLMYLAYSAFGLFGVAVLRNLLIIVPMAILYVWLLRKGTHYLKALAVTVPPTLFLAFKLIYTFERPQGMAFLLALLAVMLIERVREDASDTGETARFKHSYWLLPLLMMLWSNIHGSYILGNAIILTYMGAALLSNAYFLIRRRRGGTRRWFYAIAGSAVLASFVNPNRHKQFYAYLSEHLMLFLRPGAPSSGVDKANASSWVLETVLEYKPLLYQYAELNQKWLLYYLAFVLILAFLILFKYVSSRRVDLAEIVTVCFVSYMTYKYARLQMFSLTILPYYLGKLFFEAKRKAVTAVSAAMLAVVAIGFCVHIYGTTPWRFVPKIALNWTSPLYPAQLVSFIRQNKPEPPMYNYYTWGGFLIWSLYPEYRVFVDGRALDSTVAYEADTILKSGEGWRALLERHCINFIVIPIVEKESGCPIPLAASLAREDEWKLVFLGLNTLMFVRDIPRHKEVIHRNNIDKSFVYRGIVEMEKILLKNWPNNTALYIYMADALFELGEYEEARAIYERYPSMGADKLRLLRAMGH